MRDVQILSSQPVQKISANCSAAGAGIFCGWRSVPKGDDGILVRRMEGTLTMDIVERVARALWHSYSRGTDWDVLEPRQVDTWHRHARAAITEILSAIEEPNAEMVFEAVCEYHNHVEGRDPEAMFVALWQAMLAQLRKEIEG